MLLKENILKELYIFFFYTIIIIMVFIIIVVRVAISRAPEMPYNSGNFNSENNGGKMVRLQRRKKNG